MRPWLLWLFCALASIQSANADTKSLTAIQWLQTMESALKSSAFQGTLIYAGANQIDTLQIFHASINGIEYEHIVSLDASAQEIIRDDSKTFCFNQQQRSGRVSIARTRKHWLGLTSALKKANRFYTLQLEKQQDVIYRPAQVVNIIPRDQFRYQRKLWIDLATSIPVKTQIINARGQVIEQLMFAALTTNSSISRSRFQLPDDSKHYQWISQKSEYIPASRQRWHVVDKPAGFEIMHYLQQHHAHSERKIHIILVDGISTVSVYIDLPSTTINPSDSYYSIGAINMLTLINHGHRVTVVGEVPQQTVRLIADSVHMVE